MASPEEMSAWSIEETKAEIQALMPKGWTLLTLQAEGYWKVTVHRLGENLESVLEIEESSVDLKIALLNVYGPLYLKTLPAGSSHWQRWGELTEKRPSRKPSKDLPDPEDLDPQEVEQLYSTRK